MFLSKYVICPGKCSMQYEKNKHSAIVGWNVLCMSVRCKHCIMLSSSVYFLTFCVVVLLINTEVSNYDCSIVYFSLQLCHFCLMYLGCLLLDEQMFIIVLSSWLADPLTFNLFVSLNLKWVSSKQQIVGSYFLIHSANICLLLWQFNPLLFTIIIER